MGHGLTNFGKRDVTPLTSSLLLPFLHFPSEFGTDLCTVRVEVHLTFIVVSKDLSILEIVEL
jgi:hypothetical protein